MVIDNEIINEEATSSKKTPHFKAYLTMLVSSIFSLVASLVLSIDAIKLAKDADSPLACNINSVPPGQAKCSRVRFLPTGCPHPPHRKPHRPQAGTAAYRGPGPAA